MKQLFALFCAFALMPSFSAHAWIGGPFSNNSFFSENGDDGVYSATATGNNAIGLFRFTVANNFAGSQDINTAGETTVILDVFGIPVQTITTPGINSGNIQISGFGQSSNIWFVQGVSYTGTTLGNVDSVSGSVVGIGSASNGTAAGSDTLGSAFQAVLVRSGDFVPSTAFTGVGTGGVTDGGTGTTTNFDFTVFGTKVSTQILFGL